MNAPAQNTTQPAQTAAPAAATAAAPKKELSALGQLVVTRKNRIQSMQSEFQMALPPNVPAEKFVRTVLTAIQMNPQIAEATEQSVINACMKAATDGLILDGREAALTIYNTNKGTREQPKWSKEAQYMPMVTGIIKRVRNSGEISLFNAFVRYENDVFKRRLGLEMTLEHEPNDDNPGKLKGVYAVCKFKDGEVDYEYMTLIQIEEIRKRSKSPTKGPWATDYEEMCKKTVMRRLAKRLPMSSDLRNVIQRIDDLYDMNDEPGDTIDGTTGEILEGSEKPKRAYKKRQGAAAEIMNNHPAGGDGQTIEGEGTVIEQQTTRPSAGEQVQDAQYEEQGEGGEVTTDII